MDAAGPQRLKRRPRLAGLRRPTDGNDPGSPPSTASSIARRIVSSTRRGMYCGMVPPGRTVCAAGSTPTLCGLTSLAGASGTRTRRSRPLVSRTRATLSCLITMTTRAIAPSTAIAKATMKSQCTPSGFASAAAAAARPRTATSSGSRRTHSPTLDDLFTTCTILAHARTRVQIRASRVLSVPTSLA